MTDFIYRKENVLSFDFCRSLIELFEIDKERYPWYTLATTIGESSSLRLAG